MQKTLKIAVLAAVTTALGATLQAQAQQIGPGAFGPGATVENYDGLSLPFVNVTPLNIGGDTYTTDTGTLRYLNNFGIYMGTGGGAIGSDSDLGYININLNGSVQMAGIQVGLDVPWTAAVDFFNGNTEVGSVSLSGNGYDNGFAGWENAGGITSLQIDDTAENGHVILADNLITQAAPDASSASLLLSIACGALGVAGRKFRK